MAGSISTFAQRLTSLAAGAPIRSLSTTETKHPEPAGVTFTEMAAAYGIADSSPHHQCRIF
ncbi:MAG: hypothetical protein IPO07_28445 [Haliscomenobacter sp.]|nr:hypothetical protein [Haliscomenobacter sp.]MBK9492279.1 hypothetical protein [Haliscomenobacter sp.]